jgi:hypothetical protein
MHKPVKIISPFPKPSEIAGLLQISAARASKLARMADALVSDEKSQRKSARVPAARRSNSTRKSPTIKKGRSAEDCDAGAKSPFTARVFDELRLLAAELADRYVA